MHKIVRKTIQKRKSNVIDKIKEINLTLHTLAVDLVGKENESNERRGNNNKIKKKPNPKPDSTFNIEYKIYRMQFEAMLYQHSHQFQWMLLFCCCFAFLKRFPIVIHYNFQSVKPTHDLKCHACNFYFFFIFIFLLPIKFHRFIHCHSFNFFRKFQCDYHSDTNDIPSHSKLNEILEQIKEEKKDGIKLI